MKLGFDDLLRAVVAALAAYRIAHALSIETGPFAVFEKWRTWVLERYGVDSWQFEGATCPLCEGFWLSLLCWWLLGTSWPWVVWWWGTAGMLLVIHRALYRRNGDG